jgi:hypothetical protein
MIFFFFFLFRGIAYPVSNSEYNWFFVFYEKEMSKDLDSVVVRPFYMRNTSPDKTYKASLIPLIYSGYYTERKSEWTSLFGLIGSLDYKHKDGVKDYDFGFFPFLLFGTSEDSRDRYLHLWPFGGTIKGKLGQDRITTYAFPGFALFFLFPPALTAGYALSWTTAAVLIAAIFPAYVNYESRDYKAYGILWPFVQRGKSPDRDDFRILPFYAHNYKKGFYDNYSYGLIVNRERIFLKDDEQRTLFVFPFYGRRWNLSDKIHASTLLWPFFSYGIDSKRGSFELTFLWPFVMLQDCEKPHIMKRVFFPIYCDYEFEKRSLFFITPLFCTLKTESKNYTSEYYFNLMLVWYFKRDYKKEANREYGRSWRYFKIWPLFQSEWDDRGNFSFNCMSLLLFRDPDGYEKLYQPFWTIMEYRRMQSGEKRLGLLLRLYYQRWGSGFFSARVPVFFSYSRSDESVNRLSVTDFLSFFCYNNDKDGTHFSLLFSMFGFNNNIDGKYIRLFWIPISIGEQRISKKREKDIDNTEDSENEISGDSPENDISPAASPVFFAGNEVVLYKMRVF